MVVCCFLYRLDLTQHTNMYSTLVQSKLFSQRRLVTCMFRLPGHRTARHTDAVTTSSRGPLPPPLPQPYSLNTRSSPAHGRRGASAGFSQREYRMAMARGRHKLNIQVDTKLSTHVMFALKPWLKLKLKPAENWSENLETGRRTILSSTITHPASQTTPYNTRPYS